MKIAFMFGKGLDGCGVQRGAVEAQNWAKGRSDVTIDVFSLVERHFTRAAGHSMPKPPRNFKPEQLREVARELNGYDVVVLNSYPSFKHLPTTIVSFYRDLVLRLEKPIVVGMMHEIMQQNIDRIPLVLPILNRCDVVCNFSTKTWFSKALSETLPSKTLGRRMMRYRLWANVDDMIDKYGSARDRARRLIYLGRWTTMKDPMRLLDLRPIMMEVDPTFQLALHGIEKSVGSRVDVLAHPYCRFMQTPNNTRAFFQEYDWRAEKPTVFSGGSGDALFRSISPNMVENVPKRLRDMWDELGDSLPLDHKVQVFGPYDHSQGMRLLSETMFGSSFFRLPREPHNYGDRMEYTQIEIAAAGAIPVFDAHFGAHNLTEDGRPYDSVDHLAIWSSRDDLRATAERLVEVADDPALQRRYRDGARGFVKSEFDAGHVLPAFIDAVVSAGHDASKMDDDQLMTHLFGSGDAGRDFQDLLDQGRVPAVGFSEVESKTLRAFGGRDSGGHNMGLAGSSRHDVSDYSVRAEQAASALTELFA